MLLKDIRAIVTETMVLSPEDHSAEDANTIWFSAPPHERMGLSADEVVTAFEETAAGLRDQIAVAGHRGTATFYVWHDAVAGQLRCSTGTRKPGELDPVPYPDDNDQGSSALAVWTYDLTPCGR